jgi:hypothetical protein
MKGPERVELPTFLFVASRGQNPNGLFGVAHEPERLLAAERMTRS